MDLYNALRQIATANQNYEFMIPYIVLGLIYIVLVLIITLIVRGVEKLLSKSDRDNDRKPSRKKKVRAK